MQRSLLFLIILGLAAAGPAAAQSKPEAGVAVAVNQVQRQAIVEQTMALSRVEKESFWPLYLKYETATRAIDDRMKDLIGKYLASYDNLADRQAKVMLDQFMAIERDRLKLKRRFMKKFGRVLPPRKIVRFFQLENKMEAMTRAELATEIPLVR